MDPRVELLIGGVWTDITSDVLSRDGLLINRGRPDERQRVPFSRCNLTLNNVSGKYSNRNPMSPYYGLIGRNTQLRVSQCIVRTNDNHGAATASHFASTIGFTASAGLLMCGWIGSNVAPGTVNYTVPGSMTADTETDGLYSTMIVATEPVTSSPAGAETTTGTRLATASAATDTFHSSGLVVADNVVVRERLRGVSPGNTATSVTLTTAVGTQAGWWMLAFHSWNSAAAPGPTGGGWVSIQPGSAGFTSGAVTVWAKRVPSAGAQSVTFPAPGANVDNHAHLVVLSGPSEYLLPTTLARRFWGEVPQWPQRSDVSGKDVYVPLEAAGIMRRLGQGARQLKSPIYREATSSANLPLLVGYWPCTDGSTSTTAASGIGGPPMIASSTGVTFASDTTAFPGSQALPVCTAGGFTGQLPPYTFTGTLAFRGLFTFGPVGLTDQAVLADTFGNGAVRRWAIRYRTGGGISLHAYDQADTELGTSGAVAFNANGKSLMVGFSATQNGANIDWAIFTREARPDGSVGQVGLSGTFNTLTLTPPTTLIIGNGGNLSSTVVGHFMIGTSVALASGVWSALTGNSGETAAARMARLCNEQGVSFSLVGNAADTAVMGPQTTGTLLEVCNDCADADGGIGPYEPRNAFGLAYRTRTSLYNQTGLALDYAAGHLSPPLDPTDDDQAVKNDVTASRPNGSSARATLTSGPLSTLDPPNGIGTYEDPITVNVQTDAQLPDVAGWRLHIGTWDEARYPTVKVQLINPPFMADSTLAAAAVGEDIGGYFSIANPPSWMPPDLIEQLVQGSQERIDKVNWQIAWNATPAGPYRVVVLGGDGNLGRPYQPGSTLAAGVNTTAAALSVTVPAANPLWTTSITDVPFDIAVAGERIRVDAVGSVINVNPWLITDASGWSGDGSTLAWSTAQQYNPAYGSLFVTPTAGGLPAYARSTARVAGTATLQYQIGAWIRASTAWASGFRLGVDWYTATVGGSYISTTFHSASVVLTANTWTYLSGVVTAPATAGGGQLFVVESGTPAVTDTWFASGITYAFVGTINASPQGMTTTRSINGVVKSQLSGAAVDLWRPPALAR